MCTYFVPSKTSTRYVLSTWVIWNELPTYAKNYEIVIDLRVVSHTKLENANHGPAGNVYRYIHSHMILPKLWFVCKHHPTNEAIRSQLPYILLPVLGDVFTCLRFNMYSPLPAGCKKGQWWISLRWSDRCSGWCVVLLNWCQCISNG